MIFVLDSCNCYSLLSKKVKAVRCSRNPSTIVLKSRARERRQIGSGKWIPIVQFGIGIQCVIDYQRQHPCFQRVQYMFHRNFMGENVGAFISQWTVPMIELNKSWGGYVLPIVFTYITQISDLSPESACLRNTMVAKSFDTLLHKIAANWCTYTPSASPNATLNLLEVAEHP